MKVTLYLDKDGCERHARGFDIYNWDIAVRLDDREAPDNSILLGEVEVEMPHSDDAAAIAVKMLKQKMADIRAEAYKEELEVKDRLDKLLSISYTPATSETNDDSHLF